MSSQSLRSRAMFVAIGLCLTLGVVLGVSAGAVAQERVETRVDAFEGTGADDVAEMVSAALRDDARVELVEGERARLRVSGVVSGRGARRGVLLTARSSSGADLAQENARLGRGAAGRRAVGTAVRNLIDAAIGNLAVEASMTPAEPEPVVEEVVVVREPEPEPTSGDASSDPPILSIALGAVIRTRGTDIRLMNGGSQSYSSGVFWEATARLELRPLAHDRGLARGLFFRLDYAHAVGLGSRDGNDVQYETVFFRAFGDVGFLFGLGDVVELGAALGFGWDAYKIATNPIIPGVEYPYLRPGIRLRVRLLQELVVLDADVGFRSIFGRAALDGFGVGGDSFGVDAGLGIGGVFDFGLLWRANFAWSNYWHAFSGAATLPAASNGTDGGIQVGLTVGYGLR